MKKKNKYILITGIFILLVVLALESYLRFHEPHVIMQKQNWLNKLGIVQHNPEYVIHYTNRGRRLVPGADVVIRNHNLSGRDIPMQINALGFRDEEISLEKQPNELRILVLGDSITWGDYLPREEVWVEQAEAFLQLRFPNKKIQLINAGVGDIGLDEMVDILSERGLLVKPDIILCAVYLNDTRPPWGFPGELSNRGWLRQHSLLAEKIYWVFKLNQWIKKTGSDRFTWTKMIRTVPWQVDRQAFLQLAHEARYDWGAAWESDFEGAISQRFDNLKNITSQHNIPVIILAMPVAFQVYSTHGDDLPQIILKKQSKMHGFEFLDILPTLYSLRNKDLFFDQCHPRETTNRIIGLETARFLAEDSLFMKNLY